MTLNILHELCPPILSPNNEGDNLENPTFFGIGSTSTKVMLYCVGISIILISSYLCSIQGFIMIALQKRRVSLEDENYSNKKWFRKFIRVLWYIIINYEESLRMRSLWALLICIYFSIAGIIFNFFWFCFTLIYIFSFSFNILEVLGAVWKPRGRILSTISLCAIVIYWFGIFAYVYFGSDFDDSVKGSNLTVRRCIAIIFDSWYKYTLGAFLSDNDSSAIMNSAKNYDLKIYRVIFDFSFFFLVTTLLLGVLSGIIIDNFVDRRTHRDSVNDKKNDLCFIYGKKSNDIIDYQNHYRFVHNIWDYMYYLGYLRTLNLEKDTYDHMDAHVKSCLTTDSTSRDWFPAYLNAVRSKVSKSSDPISKKFALENPPLNSDLEKIKREMLEKMNKNRQDLKNEIKEEMTKQIDEIKSEIGDIKEEISSNREEMKEIKGLLMEILKKKEI